MVRQRLDEPTALRYPDASLRAWINDAVRDIARRTESLRATTTTAIAANVGALTPTFSAGQPIRIHLVEFQATGDNNKYTLEYRDKNSMSSVWGSWQNISTGYPVYYTSWLAPPALAIQLYPIPGVDGTVTTHYYRMPVDLATDGTAAATSLDIVAGWEDLAVDAVEYRALRFDRDPRWQEAKAEYEERVFQLGEAAIRFTDQAGMVTTQNGGVAMMGWMAGEEW